MGLFDGLGDALGPIGTIGGGALGFALGGPAGAALGAGAGGLLGGVLSGGPDDYDPASPTQRAAMDRAYDLGIDILNRPAPQYRDSIVPNFNADTLASFDAIRSQAGQTLSPLGLQALQSISSGAGMYLPTSAQLSSVAAGDYLSGNPHFEAAIEAATRPIVRQYQTAVSPQIDSDAARIGRFGSGAHQNSVDQAQDNLARSLSEAATTAAYQNYATERAAQDRAAGTLLDAEASAQGRNQALQTQAAMSLLGFNPTQQAMRYLDAENLAAIGQLQETREAARMLENREQFEARANEPVRRLSNFSQAIQGVPNFAQPEERDPFREFLGGAASGAKIGGQVSGGNPWGYGIGALLGGGFGAS